MTGSELMRPCSVAANHPRQRGQYRRDQLQTTPNDKRVITRTITLNGSAIWLTLKQRKRWPCV